MPLVTASLPLLLVFLSQVPTSLPRIIHSAPLGLTSAYIYIPSRYILVKFDSELLLSGKISTEKSIIISQFSFFFFLTFALIQKYQKIKAKRIPPALSFTAPPPLLFAWHTQVLLGGTSSY